MCVCVMWKSDNGMINIFKTIASLRWVHHVSLFKEAFPVEPLLVALILRSENYSSILLF